MVSSRSAINMDIDVKTFRKLMVLTFPFLEFMCDRYFDLDTLKQMYQDQMKASSFIYTNVFFYQKIVRDAIWFMDDMHQTVIHKLTDKMEIAEEMFDEGTYLEVCGHYKNILETAERIQKKFGDYAMYVVSITQDRLNVSTQKPSDARTAQVASQLETRVAELMLMESF